MKKFMAAVLVLTVALAFISGLFIAESQAKPPKPKPCQRVCTTFDNGCVCCQDCCPGQICTDVVCVCPL